MRGLTQSISMALLLPLAVFLCGCGGGAGKNALAGAGRKGGKGKLTVTFKWPTPAKAAKRHRFIPLASMSVVVSVNGPTGYTATSPPLTPTGSGVGATSTYTFNTVPTGTIAVTSKAFPNPDGTGTAQAGATNPNVTIQADQTANLNLTMDTTIDNGHTTITGLGQLTRTRASNYTVIFQDGGGNTVLVAPNTVTWGTDDPTIALVTVVSPDGLTAAVSGISARETNIHAIYQEPGEAAQFPNNPNRSGNFDLKVLPIIYICDNGNNNIVEIDNINGDNRATLPPSGAGYAFSQPQGVAVDSVGGVYVADTGNNRLVRINRADGSDLVSVSTLNGRNLNTPTAVAIDNSDNIYILDDGNSRVVQCTYTPNNSINFVQEWPISSGLFHNALTSTDPGTFTYTEVLTSRANGPSPAIVQFDGSASSVFHGQGVVALKFPWGVVNNSGSLIVADRDGNQLLQLDGQGSSNGIINFDTITVASRLNSFNNIALNAPRGLAADGYSNLYIADTGNQRIIQNSNFIRLGLFSSSPTYTPSGGSALNAPYAVAVDPPEPPRF